MFNTCSHIYKERQMNRMYTFFSILVLSFVPILTNFAQDNTQIELPEGAIARLGKGGINIMRFSPDGTHLAVGTDVALWLYDVPDAKETALFTEHTGQVNALAFSHEENMLASGGFNSPIIQIWDMETKSKLSTLALTRSSNSLDALTFYGRTLISIDGRDDISYWQVDTGNKLLQSSLDNSFDVVTFSQDGSNLAIADRNGKIHLWDTTTSSQQGTLKGHGDGDDSEIQALAFSPDGKILASGSEDKTVKLWDTQNHTELGTLHGHLGWVTAMAFSEDGSILASGDANKIIKLWDVETRKARTTITGHKNTINALTFAPYGGTRYSGCLASGSADGTIRFWNPINGKELTTFTNGHIESVKTIAFSEDNTTLTSAALNGIVHVWSLKTRRELHTFTKGQCDSTDTSMLSTDATLYARRGRNGLIAFNPGGFGHHGRFQGGTPLQLWKIETGDEIPGPWQTGGQNVSTVFFSPTHNVIAVRVHGEIQAWHIDTGVELFRLNARWSPWSFPVFSPDGKWIANSEASGKTKVWNVEAPNNEPIILSAEKTNSITFSPDSSILAIIGKEGIYLWKFQNESKDKPTVIPGNLQAFRSVLTFSPDGATLIGSAMGVWDIPIKLWDAETGNSLGILSGHTEPVEALVFSHDGKILASGSDDGTVLLWDWEKIVTKAKENGGN